MGFMRTGQDRQTVETVATASGKVSLGATAHWNRARVWVLAERRVVIVYSPDGNAIERAAYDVERSRVDRRRRELVVETTDGNTIVASTAGCGCGMGVVGAAGPVDGPYRVVRVRAPEWHETI